MTVGELIRSLQMYPRWLPVLIGDEAPKHIEDIDWKKVESVKDKEIVNQFLTLS